MKCNFAPFIRLKKKIENKLLFQFFLTLHILWGGEVLALFVVQEICQPVSTFPAMVRAQLDHLIGPLPLSQ